MKKADIYFIIAMCLLVPFCSRYSQNISALWQSIQHTYYKTAVSLTGNAQDLANLGQFYLEQNEMELAERYLLQAVEKGSVHANAVLGTIYFVDNKENRGEKYLKLAADEGEYPYACAFLSALYFQDGCAEKAKPYCVKAAQGGDIYGIQLLGAHYLDEGEFALAEECFQKALEKKDAVSKDLMPFLYEGLGFATYQQDKLIEAEKWLTLSGTDKSKKLLPIIQASRTPSKLLEKTQNPSEKFVKSLGEITL